MRHRRLFSVLALVAALAFTVPSLAGGWASIHLDGPIPPAYVEVPWKIGFTVLQHGVRPINLDGVALQATHRDSGETVTASATQIGDAGHYRVEAVFPRAGNWSWKIEIPPFQGTSFGTLRVLDGPSAPASQPLVTRSLTIYEGTCSSLGVARFPLSEPRAVTTSDQSAPPGTYQASAPGISVTTLTIALPALLEGDHVVSVRQSTGEALLPVACGEIHGNPAGRDLSIVLQPVNNASSAGIALLHAEGDQTTVTVYLFDLPFTTPLAPAAGGTHVIISDADSGPTFVPSQLEIRAGTTVTWINQSAVPHTVTFGKDGFDDSGPLAPGQTFSQTFDSPGTYHYRCDPHPWMTGTILVTQ
jgi:plastocyanin